MACVETRYEIQHLYIPYFATQPHFKILIYFEFLMVMLCYFELNFSPYEILSGSILIN